VSSADDAIVGPRLGGDGPLMLNPDFGAAIAEDDGVVGTRVVGRISCWVSTGYNGVIAVGLGFKARIGVF